jgi:hypothetical protein
MVALYLGRQGWLALQGAGIGINIYGMRNWQGNAPTGGGRCRGEKSVQEKIMRHEHSPEKMLHLLLNSLQ